ncbi:MAG: T9SS type A sorting domain-containing protein [Bacteroidales bacterium]|jgi:hypothetical protein|nr:T9SS type A sorting domain-containing protein [Bacteroidales bacterium]
MRIIFFIISFLYLATLSSQITFQKTYGYQYTDFGSSVETTPDNGYIVTGGSQLYEWPWGQWGLDTFAVYTIKVNMYGDTIWTKRIRINDHDRGQCVINTMDGNYVITGTTYVADPYPSFNYEVRIFLLSLDENGNENWRKTFSEHGEYGHYIQQTLDHGFIITGDKGVIDSSYNVLLIKTDIQGNVMWRQQYGGLETDNGYYVEITADSGYMIVGSTRSMGAGETDMYLIKTDQDGNLEWSRSYGGWNYEWGFHGQQTRDGGYILVGRSRYPNDDDVLCLVKTNHLGDSMWTKKYMLYKESTGNCVRQTMDQGYIITGRTDSATLRPHMFLMKTDSLGNEEWARIFDDQVSAGFSVKQTSDSGYIITGGMGPYTEKFNVVLLKLDREGMLISGIQTHEPASINIKIFPSPFTSSANLVYTLDEPSFVTIEFFNSHGQFIQKKELQQPKGEQRVKWNTEYLPSGIYFCRIYLSTGECGTSKLLKY